MDTDLSMSDIIFLRTVRDINSNPEAYAKTGLGAVPANKMAIVEATDLNKREVSYRLGGGDSRGFDEGDEPYIISHDPEITENNTFGPRSAEITQAGLDLLSELDDGGLSGESDVPESIKQLRARIDELEDGAGGSGNVDGVGGEIESIQSRLDELESTVARLDELESQVAEYENREWGGVDQKRVDHLDSVIDNARAMAYLLNEVFGTDVTERVEEGPFETEAEVEAARAMVFDILSSASASSSSSISDSGSGSESESREGSGSESDSESGSTKNAKLSSPKLSSPKKSRSEGSSASE